jgi:hypothetical protein
VDHRKNTSYSKYDNIETIPYAERQLIVVMDDEFVAAQRKSKDTISASFDWEQLLKTAGKVVVGGYPGAIVMAGVAAYEAWERAKKNGVNALQIKDAEAKVLTFAPTHPRRGVLYVGHPSDPKVYYTVASFHRMAFEHKFAEALDLLMHLGATKIKVEHIRGWSSEFAASLSVPLHSGPVSASAGTHSRSNSSLLFESSLPNNQSKSIPENLVWYPHEPAWQAIAKGRLSFSMKEFSLVVNYDEDFGINAGLKVAAAKAGLDLGGNFQNHEQTSWRIVGTFASAT